MPWLYVLFQCSAAVTTLQYGAKSNTSQFEGYPSYEIDRPINEQIQVFAPIGNGTMRETIHIEPAQDASISNLLA